MKKLFLYFFLSVLSLSSFANLAEPYFSFVFHGVGTVHSYANGTSPGLPHTNLIPQPRHADLGSWYCLEAVGSNFKGWKLTTTTWGGVIHTRYSTSDTVHLDFSIEETGSRHVIVDVYFEYRYNVTAVAGEGGSVTGGGGGVAPKSFLLTAYPDNNHTFSCWKKGSEVMSTSATYRHYADNPCTLTAYFTPKKYSIIASTESSTKGFVSGDGYKDYNTTCTLVANAKVGYEFDCWKEGGSVVSRNASYSFKVKDNRTLKAYFKTKYYMISTSSDISKGVTTGGGPKVEGSVCRVSATACSGYIFSKWKVGTTVVSMNKDYSFTVYSDKALTAEFVKSATIVAQSNNSSYGSVTGGGTKAQGATCTLRAYANPGYEFQYWKKGLLTKIYSSTYSFVVSGNETWTAHFKAKTKSSPANGTGVNDSLQVFTEEIDVEAMPMESNVVKVYPNPTNGQLLIASMSEVQNIIVYDFSGKIVAQSKNSSMIDLGGLPSSLYIVRVTTQKGVSVHKVTKH